MMIKSCGSFHSSQVIVCHITATLQVLTTKYIDASVYQLLGKPPRQKHLSSCPICNYVTKQKPSVPFLNSIIALLFGSFASIRDFTVLCGLVQSCYTPTHSGSGSIMEALSLQKPLVVVVNDRLMNNHQTELARQLCKDGHLLYTTHR